MHITSPTLSDGEECHVRQLGLFELDEAVPLPQIGRFTYEMKTIDGSTYEVEFLIEKFKEPPKKPPIQELDIVEGSPAWYDLRTWQLYQAALLHEKRRSASLIQYKNDVLTHILNHCLQEPADIRRIVTDEDWEKVYDAAIVDQVTYELLAETLRTTFRASFANQEIFEAFDIISGGLSRYDAIKKWEVDVMLAMKMTETEYALMPVKERARKLCALHLDDWLGALQAEVDRKKMDADAARREQKAKGKRGK